MYAVPEDKYEDAQVERSSTPAHRRETGYSDSWRNLSHTRKPLYIRNLLDIRTKDCDPLTDYLTGATECVDGDTIRRIEQQQRRTLLTVDDGLGDLFEALDTLTDADGNPLIENTYIFYASDNGFMWGEHRVTHDKAVPYQESIRVPMLVTGPDIESKHISVPVSLVDLVPTILDVTGLLAGFDPESADRHPLDGESLLPLATGRKSDRWFALNVRAGVFAESVSRKAIVENIYGQANGLRIPAWNAYMQQDWKLVAYDPEHPTVQKDPLGVATEFYRLKSDPYEIRNLDADSRWTSRFDRMQAIAHHLAGCRGTSGPTSCSIPLKDTWAFP